MSAVLMLQAATSPPDKPKEYDDLPADACRVQAFNKKGSLVGLWIEFKSDILRFPSKNQKAIHRNPKTGKRFINKDKRAQVNLGAMTHLYRLACGGRAPTFSSNLVKAICIIPPSVTGRRFDSHNFGESIADWLQGMGVISDDSLLQLECIKRDDYERFSQYLTPFDPRFRFPTFSEDRLATTLVLLKRDDQVERVIHAHLLELIKLSTGKLELIG
jgi:hypothetical protein